MVKYCINFFLGSYVGCYQDDGSNRALPDQQAGGSPNEPKTCMEKCKTAGNVLNRKIKNEKISISSRGLFFSFRFFLAYKFAGAQYGSECWCGNSVGHAKLDDTSCDTTCSGNSNFKCGSSLKNSIYRTTDFNGKSLSI